MNWQTVAVFFFLMASLLLYLLFGGADFGAGIVELFLGRAHRREQRRLISHAMAPVWEANHVWLILAVVILFVAFPRVYTTLTVSLHLPLMAVLLGIVGRGCAFTFRHYDTYNSDFYLIYSKVFAFSSLWTAFFLGILTGALMLGSIDPNATTFAAAYLDPWCNGFCFSVGIFTVSLCAFLSTVYLVGEAETVEMRDRFLTKAKWALRVLVAAGALAFATSEWQGFSLMRLFWSSPACIACFVGATVLLLPFWTALRQANTGIAARVIGALLICTVAAGWATAQFPYAVRLAGGGGISFAEAAAPVSTLNALLVALVVGSCLIFPAFAYLLTIFKWETLDAPGNSGHKF